MKSAAHVPPGRCAALKRGPGAARSAAPSPQPFKDNEKDNLAENNISEDNFLSLNILQGLCEIINEDVEIDDQLSLKIRHIHLELNQERLLLR